MIQKCKAKVLTYLYLMRACFLFIDCLLHLVSSRVGRDSGILWASLMAQMTASACSTGDPGLIPGSGRSPGERNGYPFQYSCLENPMDRGIWQAILRGVAQSQTQLNNTFTFTGNSLWPFYKAQIPLISAPPICPVTSQRP